MTTTTTITVKPAGRAPSLAKSLPVTLDFPKPPQQITIGEVKAALQEKFPRVRLAVIL